MSPFPIRPFVGSFVGNLCRTGSGHSVAALTNHSTKLPTKEDLRGPQNVQTQDRGCYRMLSPAFRQSSGLRACGTASPGWIAFSSWACTLCSHDKSLLAFVHAVSIGALAAG